MTPEEAIKILDTLRKQPIFAPVAQKALKLGIEALKWIQEYRKVAIWPKTELLPGETEE